MAGVPSLTTSTQTENVVNGKRASKNASASNKQKKSTQPITKFFIVNGHDKCADKAPNENDEMKSKPFHCDLTENSNDFPALPQSPMNFKKKPQQPPNDVASELNDSNCNANGFLSPKPKMVNGSCVKQTTPHRIVALASPSKKQRLYEKINPVEVFEDLIIDDEGASVKSRANKATNKNESQRSRRKLIGQETENVANERKEDASSIDDIVPLQHIGTATEAVATGVDAKKPILNSTIDPSAQQNTTNNKKLMAAPVVVPPRAPRTTQLTDFFPIRRSGRKTKKTVEQEHLLYIELAIEKQLEDGLVVKMFPEKGRGIVAGRPFARGEFVVEYIGQLIDQTEADRREESYAKNVDFGCYMYYFKHKEQQWWYESFRVFLFFFSFVHSFFFFSFLIVLFSHAQHRCHRRDWKFGTFGQSFSQRKFNDENCQPQRIAASSVAGQR